MENKLIIFKKYLDHFLRTFTKYDTDFYCIELSSIKIKRS